MNRMIWKFQLDLVDIQSVKMPAGAEILTAQMQNEVLCLWALVSPEKTTLARFIEIQGTGCTVNGTEKHPRKYIATVQQDGFVWHVFERL